MYKVKQLPHVLYFYSLFLKVLIIWRIFLLQISFFLYLNKKVVTGFQRIIILSLYKKLIK